MHNGPFSKYLEQLPEELTSSQARSTHEPFYFLHDEHGNLLQVTENFGHWLTGKPVDINQLSDCYDPGFSHDLSVAVKRCLTNRDRIQIGKLIRIYRRKLAKLSSHPEYLMTNLCSVQDVNHPTKSFVVTIAQVVTSAIFHNGFEHVDAIKNFCRIAESVPLTHADSNWPIEYSHSMDGTFVTMNPAGCKLFGVSSEHITQYNVRDILHPSFGYKEFDAAVESGFSMLNSDTPITWMIVGNSGAPWPLETIATIDKTPQQLILGRARRISSRALEALKTCTTFASNTEMYGWVLPENSSIVSMTKSMTNTMGFVGGEISWEDLVEKLSPGSRRLVKDIADDILKKKIHRISYEFESADETRTFQAESSYLHDGKRGLIVTTFNETTLPNREHKLLEAIFDNDPNFIFVKDGQGRFVEMNQSLQQFYNEDNFTSSQKTDRDYFGPWMSDSEILNQVDQFEEDDRSARTDLPRLHTRYEKIVPPGGSKEDARVVKTVKRGINFAGSVHVFGVATDITEATNHRQVITEVLDKLPVPISMKNARHQYIYCNLSFVELFGMRSVENVIGRTASDIVDKDSAKRVKQFEESLFNGSTRNNYELDVTLHDGRELSLIAETSLHSLPGNTGKSTATLLSIDYDVARQKRDSNARVTEMLLTSLKHDYVQNFLMNIRDRLSNDIESVNESEVELWVWMLKMASGFISRLQWLASSSSEVHNKRGASLREVDIKEHMSIAMKLADIAEREVPQCRIKRCDVNIINTDPELFTVVLFNHIFNAKRYTALDKNENIFLTAVLDSRVRDGVESQGVRFEIDDGGVGIPSKFKSQPLKMYEFGERAEPAQGMGLCGTGKGLYECKVFVCDKLRGEIDAPQESKRNGSLFSFWLPIRGPVDDK